MNKLMERIRRNGSVIFTFDDGHASVYQRARGIFARHGVAATAFVVGSLVESKAPDILTIDQIKSLEHDYAWDIYSHTWDHTKMIHNTPEHNAAMLEKNLEWMQKNGIGNADWFAYPWGRTDDAVTAVVRKYHKYARICMAKNRFFESFPFELPYEITARPFSPETPLHEAKTIVDDVARDGKILFFYSHWVTDQASYMSCGADDLDQLIRHCKARGVNVLNFSSFLQVYGDE